MLTSLSKKPCATNELLHDLAEVGFPASPSALTMLTKRMARNGLLVKKHYHRIYEITDTGREARRCILDFYRRFDEQ